MCQIGDTVIILGIILLLAGFVTGISTLWTIWMVLAVIGVAMWILGSLGARGRWSKHYW